MKMTNTLCSTSCSSYSELPEPGFYLCTIKSGETYVIEPDDNNHLVFLRSGSFIISSEERVCYRVVASNVVFCSRSYLYTIVAEEDSQILVARFVNGNITSEGDTYRSIATEVAKVNYRFTAVPINNVLGSVIDSIAFYLEQGANSKAMHHAKIEEMFVVFRYFYPREVYLRMFYSLFNNNMSFRTLVINNAPNAKNVEHLAKICGHSLSHFKLLFSQYFDTTPYVWMQRNRAIEISELLRDPSMPLKNIIKKYGFTSHGHFSLFCRKFLGDTPRALRRRSHLATSPVTLEDVKKNMERQSRQKAATKKAATGEAPRRRGRPRKNEVR